VVWRWEGEAFGDVEPDEDPDGDGASITINLRFPGQYADQESGIYQNYFRDYEPAHGRYIQGDPIGIRGGYNLFSYTNNRPTRTVDIRGLVEWKGSVSGGELLIVFGGGGKYFNLVSECVNGQQAEAEVLFVGGGVGGSLGFTVIPVSAEEDLIFRDSNTEPEPFVFDGQAGMVSMGVQLAPVDFGIRRITLGDAQYESGTGVGATGGVEIGGFVITGSSTVLDSKIRECPCDER